MIYNKNDISSLSKGLIAAVRGVMENKEGGHPKTEKQKDLASKAPPHDKITHADVLVGRGVLKKHPTTGKLVTKEEVEELDELSKKTLGSYIKKAIPDAEHKEYWGRADRPTKGQRQYLKSAKNRRRGINKAIDKLTNEEVQIDEIGNDTLRRYRMKAKSIADNEGGKDRSAGRDLAGRKSYGGRVAGIPKAKVMAREEVKMSEDAINEKDAPHVKDYGAYGDSPSGKKPNVYGGRASSAKEKMIADFNKPKHHNEKPNRYYKESNQIDEALDVVDRFKHHHDNAKNLLKSIGDHLKTEHDAAMKSADWKGRKGPNWGHVGSMESISTQLGQIHDMLARRGGYAESVEVEAEITLTEEEIASLEQIAGSIEQIDELSDMALKVYVGNAYNDYLKKSKNRMPGEDETDAMKKRKNSLSLAHKKLDKKLAKEEVEELDELSVKTLDQYRTKARKDIIDTDDSDEKRINKRAKGYMDASKQVQKKLAKEEVEELDEARGRPPKEGSPAWKRRQEAEKKGEIEGDEPRQHIIQQLQRAKLSMLGSAKIKFKNGEEHEVKGTHAAKVLDKYAGMKPAEKEEYQKKLASSHTAFKGEL